jgi:hypothetical protein
MTDEQTNETKDSVTIGTPATCGAVKVYVDFSNLQEADTKVGNALKMAKKLQMYKDSGVF